jgi:hypothetical protein
MNTAEIMPAGNYLTPVQLRTVFQTNQFYYTTDQLLSMAAEHPSEAETEFLRNQGALLFPTPAKKMNLLELYKLRPEFFFATRTKARDYWFRYPQQRFSRTDTVKPATWLAILPEPRMGTESVPWNARESVLGQAEYVPNAAEVCYAALVARRLFGRYVFTQWARTSSRHAPDYSTSDERHEQPGQVIIGDHDERGLGVDSELAGEPHHALAIAYRL